MIREVILRGLFLESLIEIESYLSQYMSLKSARKFSSEAIGFVSDTIAQNPFAFVRYESQFLDNVNIRRAVFKSSYCIVYEVFEDRIEILNIYHNSRNPDSIDY